MSISNLGYLTIGATQLEAWAHFAEKLMGAQAVPSADGQALNLRIDDYLQRIRLVKSKEDDLLEAGWEFNSEAELDAYAQALRSRDVKVEAGTAEQCAERCVEKLYRCADPIGYTHVFYCGPRKAPLADSFRQTVGKGAGFKTGDLGLGHFVAVARDYKQSVSFYQDVLGLRISDYIREEVAPGMLVDATFFHTKTGRHHSLATGQLPGDKRLNHIMVEFNDMDDVGLAYDRFVKASVPVIMAPGHHPNDQMFSFYVITPGGFGLEMGWGGLVVGEDWSVTSYSQLSDWGHARFPFGHPGQ